MVVRHEAVHDVGKPVYDLATLESIISGLLVCYASTDVQFRVLA
jgi:hypothetical protein